MPRSHNAALKKGKRILDRVSVNLPHDVDSATMVDGFVRNARTFCGIGIGSKVVSNNHVHIGFDVLPDVLRECSRFYVISVKEPQIAVPLSDADDNFFIVVFCCMALADVPAANIGFVHLDGASKFWLRGFFHCGPDPVAEIPCGLVADSQRAVNLVCAYALLRFAEKKRSHEPLFKRQMGVVKDRASRYSKLVIAALAVEDLFLSVKFYCRVATARALWATRPAESAEQFTALFRRAVAAY